MTEDFYAVADGPKRRQRALADHNRRVIAERMHWPDGAVEACEALERAHPGWVVAWMPQNRVAGTTDFDRDAGFYAWRAGEQPGYMAPGYGFIRRRELFAVDAAELARALD